MPVLYPVLMLVVLLAGTPAWADRPLRLGTNVWPGYEPLYIAAHREDWNGRLDLRLIEYPSATEVLRAFRNQALEAAALTLDEVLVLRESGLPLKVVLVLDVSAGGDVVLARPGIERFTQLRGRRVAVESGALGAYVLTRALDLHGMQLGDVEVVHLDVAAQEAAYRNGSVDGVVTFDPMRTRLLAAGAHEVFTSKEIPGEIVDVLVVHEAVWRDEQPRLRELAAGWFRALDYLRAEPHQAAAFTAQRLKVPPEAVLRSYRGMELPDPAENARLLDGALDEALHRLQETLVREQLLITTQDTGRLLDAGLLPETARVRP